MKKRIISAFAILLAAACISPSGSYTTYATPVTVIAQETNQQNEKRDLSEYMKTVYTVTDHPELDPYVFEAFQRMEDADPAKRLLPVYEGTYAECETFRDYFNYQYGYTYDLRLTMYHKPGAEKYSVGLMDASGLEPKIEAYLDQVEYVQNLAASLKGGTDDDTANKVINWVANNLSYDYSLHGTSDFETMARSCYGFYNGNKTLCIGYAMGIYQLCSMNGIPATIQIGTYEGGPHAWNSVRIGGEFKHVDVLNLRPGEGYSTQLPSNYKLR